MKKGLMAAALAVTTAIAVAQDGREVTVSEVLDTATDVGGSVYASTYVPGAHKFLATPVGASVVVLNADTGAVEGNLDMTGISIVSGSLGLFAITAGSNGTVYGYEDSAKAIYRWEDVNSAPESVYEGAAGLFRVGAVGVNGNDVSVAFTGAATDGPVEFFSDSMPFASESFTFNESVQLDAKSGLAMNSDGTQIFTVGDTGALALTKWSKTDGVWGAEPDWESDPIGGGPMAYDEVNDLLFVLSQPNGNLYVLEGSTGEILLTQAVQNAPYTTTGYNGGYVAPDGAGSGTVYLAARGSGSTLGMYVYDYTVEGASVDDWSLYQQ